jgi:hypothetical protein
MYFYKTLKTMKIKINSWFVLLLVWMGIGLTACDLNGEETMSWRPGSGLHIIGETEVEVGTAGEAYYVDGFTIKENYTWQLNGTPLTPTRGGEFVTIDFPVAGSYTITVTNGTYEGRLVVTAVEGE